MKAPNVPVRELPDGVRYYYRRRPADFGLECPFDPLVPTLDAGGNRVGHRAMLRRDRPARAMLATPTKICAGWPEKQFAFDERGNVLERVGRFQTPDEEFAKRHDLRIEVDGRGRQRLRIPPFLRRTCGYDGKRGGSSLHYELETRTLFATGRDHLDSVVELFLKNGGRRVFVHSWAARVVHRMLLLALADRADRTMSNHAHAYRAGRSRMTALTEARTALRSGRPFVAHLDIVGFFDAITEAHLWHALRMELPWTTNDLRSLIMEQLRPCVVRPPSHTKRSAPEPKGASDHPGVDLPTGSPLAPFLANVVATLFIDRPLEHYLPAEANFVRYSDNILLVAEQMSVLVEAVEIVKLVMQCSGFVLHPHEGGLIDARKTPAPFLGKALHGGSVITPSGVLAKIAHTLRDLDLDDARFLGTSVRAAEELYLDPRPERRLAEVRKLLRADHRKIQAFDRVARAPLALRRGPVDPEPDELVADELAEQAKEECE